MKTLILTPSPVEFESLAGAKTADQGPRHRVLRSGDLVWALCGIGPAAATLSASMLIATERPERVLLAGIAGAFRGCAWSPGHIVQARSECFADLGYCQDGGFVTLDQMNLPMLPLKEETFGCHFPLSVLDEQTPTAISVTVSSVTSDDARAAALRRDFNADIENMEGAGVALACAYHSLPFYQVRAISNWVGPRDPSTWLIKEPLALLRDWVRARL